MNVHEAKLQAIKNKKSRQDTPANAIEHKKLTDTLLELKNAVDELKTSVKDQPELDTSELEGNISHLQKTIAGFEIKQENVDLKPIVEQIKQIKNVVNVPELKTEGLADKESINVLNESITKVVDRLVSLEENIKPGQEPYNYLPIRRVVYRGNKLEFDDSSWGGSYGGGGMSSGSSNGLTDAQLRATPVDVALTTGDIEIGAVELKNSTDDTRATITAGNALKVDGSATTQPVSGTVTATAQPGVDIGDVTVNNTTTNPVPVQPPLSGYLNVSIDQTGNNNAVDVLTMPTVTTTETVPSTIYNGKKTVTTAGTRVTLASSQAVKSVTIKALSTNTGIIYVGDTSVASTNGFQLSAGETISMDIANLNTVNLDSSVSGESVTYIGVN